MVQLVDRRLTLTSYDEIMIYLRGGAEGAINRETEPPIVLEFADPITAQLLAQYIENMQNPSPQVTDN